MIVRHVLIDRGVSPDVAIRGARLVDVTPADPLPVVPITVRTGPKPAILVIRIAGNVKTFRPPDNWWKIIEHLADLSFVRSEIEQELRLATDRRPCGVLIERIVPPHKTAKFCYLGITFRQNDPFMGRSRATY